MVKEEGGENSKSKNQRSREISNFKGHMGGSTASESAGPLVGIPPVARGKPTE
jgi:hypothetical protein